MKSTRLGRKRAAAVAVSVAITGAGGAVLTGTSLVGAAANDNTHTHEAGVDPDHGNHYHAADLNGEGRFSAQGDVWPPRPDGAGAPTRIQQAEPGYNSEPLAVRGAERSAVDEHLGERWDVLEIAEGVSGGKGQSDRSRQVVTYFSYDLNQSVQVEMRGANATDIKIIEPSRAQLPLNPNEKARAVEIARAHWADQGQSAVNDLEGFSIQAFQPDGQFYGVRMVYVSFHENADTRPDFLTWVDLSNETVADSKRDEG